MPTTQNHSPEPVARIRQIGAAPRALRRYWAAAQFYRCKEPDCFEEVVALLDCPCGSWHLFCRYHAAKACFELGLDEPNWDAFLERN